MTNSFPLLNAALDDHRGPVEWFFRDDDAGWANAELIALCDTFGPHPLDLAVIPAEVDPDFVPELVSRPGGLRFHQHGYRHENYQHEGKKCEFGTHRQVIAIEADLHAGRETLLSAFVGRLDPIFTPPWNRCTRSTAAAVSAMGVRVLSRDKEASPFHIPGLDEVPVTVDWERARGSLDHGLARAAQIPPVGVMLHHAVLSPADLGLIEELLALLSTHPNVVLTSMIDLAESRDDL